MNVVLLIALAFYSFLAVLLAFMILARVEHPEESSVVEPLVAFIIALCLAFVSMLMLLLMFVVFAKPTEVTDKNFSLESFAELSNGYEYSYYNDNGDLIGGFVEREAAELDFYDDGPFINIYNKGQGKRFWFIYSGEDLPDHYTFHVINRKSIEINKTPK